MKAKKALMTISNLHVYKTETKSKDLKNKTKQNNKKQTFSLYENALKICEVLTYMKK